MRYFSEKDCTKGREFVCFINSACKYNIFVCLFEFDLRHCNPCGPLCDAYQIKEEKGEKEAEDVSKDKIEEDEV